MNVLEEKSIRKQYAQLPRSSIQLMLESVSKQNFHDDTLSLLAENCNYVLRETVQHAARFMRHAGRNQLTTDDMNRALSWTDNEPVYGHNCTEAVSYVHEEDVFAAQDYEVDLLKMSNESQTFETLPQPTLNVWWVTVEGLPKSASQPSLGQSVCPSSSQVIKIADPCRPEKKNGDEKAKVLSEDYVTYFSLLTSAVLSDDELLVKTALNDLCSNTKICPLLPHFTNFIAESFRTFNQKIRQMRQLLCMIQALMRNPFMYLGHETTLNWLVQSVLYCIVEPQDFQTKVAKDHWGLRDFAANVLMQIIDQWATAANNLYQGTLKTLETVFVDPQKPLWSHYGAIVAISAFGADAIEKALYPHMFEHIERLDAILGSSTRGREKIKEIAERKEQAMQVRGALMLAAELYIKSIIKTVFGENVLEGEGLVSTKTNFQNQFPTAMPTVKWGKYTLEEWYQKKSTGWEKDQSEKTENSLCAIYKQCYEYFGSDLVDRIPFINVQFLFTPAEKQTKSLLYPDSPCDPEFEDESLGVNLTSGDDHVAGAVCNEEKEESTPDGGLQVKATPGSLKLKIFKVKRS